MSRETFDKIIKVGNDDTLIDLYFSKRYQWFANLGLVVPIVDFKFHNTCIQVLMPNIDAYDFIHFPKFHPEIPPIDICQKIASFLKETQKLGLWHSDCHGSNIMVKRLDNTMFFVDPEDIRLAELGYEPERDKIMFDFFCVSFHTLVGDFHLNVLYKKGYNNEEIAVRSEKEKIDFKRKVYSDSLTNIGIDPVLTDFILRAGGYMGEDNIPKNFHELF